MTTRDKRLRQLIREYREMQGLSQSDVADRIGITRMTYQRLEAGVGRTKRIAEICAAIGLDYATLMREAGFESVKEEPQ